MSELSKKIEKYLFGKIPTDELSQEAYNIKTVSYTHLTLPTILLV